MTPTETGLLIIAVVVVMAAIAFTIQSIENERRERRMRLLVLKDQVRRADHLLRTLPEHYITREIRDLLVQYLRQRWKLTLELERTEENRQGLQEIEELGSQSLPVVEHPSGSMTLHTDRNHAERTASLLRELFQFLSELKQQGGVRASDVEEVVHQVKEAYTRTRIDVEIMDAIETELARGAAPALPRFRTAMAKLQGFNSSQQLDKQVYEISTHIDELQEIVERERKEKEAEEKRRRAEERAKEEQFNPRSFSDYR